MAEAQKRPQRAGKLFRAITVAGALLLGACQTIVPRGPAEAPPPRVVQGPPPPNRTGTDVDTGVTKDAARNRVALLVPLSGSNAAVGTSLANATQLALLDTKTEKVRITRYDTATGAAAAANRAIADGAQLILGPLLSEDVRAVAPIARRAGVPVLAFSNDVGVAGDGTYVMGYAPTQSIDRVVGYAKSRGIANFGGLVPNALYGTRASTAFLRSVESAGGRVVALQTYDRGSGALTAAVNRMAKDAPFDAIMIADGGNTAAAAVPLLRRDSPQTHILGTELWNSESAIATKPALSGAWFASVSDTLYRQYAQKYRMRFGGAPFRLSSLGYDAVLLAVRISRDWRVGAPFPEARLRAADGFAGIDGAFRFGRDSVADRVLEVQEIRGGTTVVVSPAPAGFGSK